MVVVTNLPTLPPLYTSNVSLTYVGTPLEQALTKRLEEMEAMIQRIPRVPTPLKKSQPYSYIDFLFIDALALIEMPRKFSFPNMKLYDGTTDPTDHIASYKQRVFTAAIPHDLQEACMCKSSGQA